ncbi:MAG: GWxTD domain-containing protein, partial [Calditrichia bacterium]
GNHRLKAVYTFAGDSIRLIVPFSIIWFDKPVSLWDYQLAVEPIRYIVEEAEYKELAKGGDKLKKLEAFWKERDPTPETPFNELKKEFYSRVDSTLARFSTRRRLGWHTDLGKIYISNGPPDKIEDHSLDPVPNPYLQWIYYHDGKQLVYTFEAVNGRKEYKLADARETSL